MRKTFVKPVYRMSLPDLSLLNDKALMLIDRDGTILTNYGINNDTVTFLTDTNHEIVVLPSDVYLKGQVSVCTEKRDTTADEIRVAVRDVMLRPKMKFGESSAAYRSFGTSGMDKLDPIHLYFCATIVAQVAQTYLSELGNVGLTQAIIDALTALNTTFHQQIVDKVKAVAYRDTITEKRIVLANSLYNRISQVFEVGKTYWFDKSEAKYNDYVIYNTPNLKKPEPGQYGSIHGTILRSDNHLVPDNTFVFIDGVEAPIIPDENGDWEMDMVPVGKPKIRATAEECHDFEDEIEILADQDISFDIVMEPMSTTPPA